MRIRPQVLLNRFDQTWCQRVRDEWFDELATEGSIGDGSKFGVNRRIRRVKTNEINNPAIIGDMIELFQQANAEWQFDINGETETRLLHYSADDLGEYKEHKDCFWRTGSDRKLTAIVWLNDPEEYDGGILNVETSEKLKQPAGTAVVFPSYLIHSVERVTRGDRWILVAVQWGPAWR